MAQNNQLTDQADLVSIVIPVYNTGKYLVNCLQSCADQTYKNIEVIVVDDCSTDPFTKGVLKEFEEKDPRFKVIYSTPNQGQGPCRNMGVDAARGKYFSFVDSDDYLSKDCIERMVQGMKEFNVDFVLCDIQKDYSNVEEGVENSGLSVNVSDAQFNLLHVQDRSIMTREHILENNCLAVLPASCYGKLFDLEKYRKAGIRFAGGYLARKCQDQDWKFDIFLSFERFLNLKFVGYTRIVRMDSVSRPSLHHIKCNIASYYRTSELLKRHGVFESFRQEMLSNIISLGGFLIAFTEKFEDRQKALEFVLDFVNKTDPQYNLNPYVYSDEVSRLWLSFFRSMDYEPLFTMYFNLRPLHDVPSSDVVYIREMLESLIARGVNLIAYNGLWSNNSTPSAFLHNSLNAMLNHSDEQNNNAVAMDAHQKSNVALAFDNAVNYITPSISSNEPNKLTPLELRYLFVSLIQSLEKAITNDLVKADTSFADRIRLSQEKIRSIEQDENTYLFNVLNIKYPNPHLTEVVKAINFGAPKVVMVSGGDLVTQQACRNFKTAGCKIIYLVAEDKDLVFNTVDEGYDINLYSQSLHCINPDRDNLSKLQSVRSFAYYKYTTAQHKLEQALEKHRLAKFDSNIKVELLPTQEKIAELKQEADKLKQQFDQLTEQVSQAFKEMINPEQFSPVDPKYIFAPSEIDAAISFRKDLAKIFTQNTGVEVKVLGYMLNHAVNKVAETKRQVVTFFHPVIENGLAIFMKLMHCYTQRHPDTKFMVLQDSEDTFLQDLNKLHDVNGQKLGQLKLNLSALKISSSDKVDPITACETTKVLLKLGLDSKASVCSLPEAILNDIPVLATNHVHYAELIEQAGKLLPVPASTQQDPTCLPSDEEIAPYLEALEELMSNDFTAQCQQAAAKFDFEQNSGALDRLLYELSDKPYTHDHPDDGRHINLD